MADNNDIDSLDSKKNKKVKSKVNIPIKEVKEEKPVIQYSTPSNVVMNFINEHKADIGNTSILPSPNVSCLDCLFARWRKETDEEIEYLQCYCKDLNIPIWSGALQREVTDCDGPEIGKALAKRVG